MGIQKEKDWALMGGLASGLAGGAAGLATALDTQIQNAEIRAQNEQYIKRMAPAIMNMSDLSSDARKKAANLNARIEETKLKLVAEIDGNEIMKCISFSDTKVSISKTGAFSIDTKAQASNIPDVLGGRRSVIDGTIAVNMCQNNRNVGSALLVLPLDGLYKSSVSLKGICCCDADPAADYELHYSPYKLWIMEA